MESHIVIPDAITILYFCEHCFQSNLPTKDSPVCYYDGDGYYYTNYNKLSQLKGNIGLGFTPHIVSFLSFLDDSGGNVKVKFKKYCGVCAVDIDKASLPNQRIIEVNFKKGPFLEICSLTEWSNLFEKRLK